MLAEAFSGGKAREMIPERQSALRWGEQRGAAGESAILSAAAQQISAEYLFK